MGAPDYRVKKMSFKTINLHSTNFIGYDLKMEKQYKIQDILHLFTNKVKTYSLLQVVLP